MPAKVCLDGEWDEIALYLVMYSAVFCWHLLLVKLIWLTLWILNKPILHLAVCLRKWPAPVQSGSRNVYARRRAALRNSLELLCFKKYNLESNWLWNYINIFCWREASSSLTVVSLLPNSPVSLDASNVEANENITKQKNSSVWKMMAHSSQGKHLITSLKLRIYLSFKNCVLTK